MPVFYYGYPDANPDERWKFWSDNPPPAIAVDTETVSMDERHPIGLGIAFSPMEAFYFQLTPEPPSQALEAAKRFLTDIRIIKIAHNWMFDMGVLPLIPVIGKSVDRINIWDSNIAARLLGYEETALPILAFNVLNTQMEGAADLLRKHGKKNMAELDPMVVAEHCQSDVKLCYRLWLEWKDKIQKQYGDYFRIEMAVIPILLDMSMRGIAIDQQARADLSARYGDEIEFYKRQVQEHGITNPGSPQQVGYMLAKRGNFLRLTKSKRQLQTREEDLEFLDDPLAATVLGYRKKSKFKNTYLDPLEGADRFYTEYYLDTVVGRLNSRNRNIQNIPLDARYMFLPDHGVFTTGDYSKEHMYILAQMSQDKDMLRVLYDPDPRVNDIHQYTADRMHISRKLAKTVNYAVIYGATDRTISETAKIKDRRFCQKLLDDWFTIFLGAADWIIQAQREGLKSGWALPTLFNRRIRIPLESDDSMRRKACNYPILGSDGEVIKRAIVLCNHRRLGPPILAITVHDSLTWDGDVQSQLPIKDLENIPGYRVPFEVKQTMRWE